MSESRCLPDSWMSLRYSACFSLSSPNSLSFSASEKPMIALSGVRSSCDMLARKSDLCLFATSSCALFSWISLNRRTFSIAITAWSAKLVTTSICFSVNGALLLLSEIRPIASPSRSIGTASTAR